MQRCTILYITLLQGFSVRQKPRAVTTQASVATADTTAPIRIPSVPIVDSTSEPVTATVTIHATGTTVHETTASEAPQVQRKVKMAGQPQIKPIASRTEMAMHIKQQSGTME